MKIIPLSIPTPFYVGDVNVYLIKEDPLTLIDVGPKTKEAADALREKLRRNGVEFSDVRRIVLTHAHEDHCGLGKTGARRSEKRGNPCSPLGNRTSFRSIGARRTPQTDDARRSSRFGFRRDAGSFTKTFRF